MGSSRIALGYLGALLALVAYCYIETADLSRTKVARGDVTAAEAAQYFSGWFLNIFCLMTPFMVFFLTALGLPLLAALRRINFASIVGAMLSSQVLAACFSLPTVLSPYNQWCDSHVLQCFASAYASNAILAGTVTAGFVLAARLPWWRSLAMPANNALERERGRQLR